jgi:hypothetical protein
MNHCPNFDFLAFDAIDHDEVSAGDDEFSGAFPSGFSKMREVSQPLHRRYKANKHSVRSFGIIEGDVMPNLVNLTPRLQCPDYPHELGSSWALPQTHFGAGRS